MRFSTHKHAGSAFKCWHCTQELSSILEFVPDLKPERKKGAATEVGEEAEGQAPLEAREKKRKLQTFVFSATLTLPESLRRRLKRGKSLFYVPKLDAWKVVRFQRRKAC